MSLKSWRYDLHVFYNRPRVRSFLKLLLFPVAIYYMLGGKRKASLDKLVSDDGADAGDLRSRMKKGIMFSSFSTNNHEVMELSLLNHKKYCTLHNLSFMYVNEPYTPYINCELICSLLKQYDFVAAVGTDIFFTNFSKDIRDFIVGPIVIQDEGTGFVQGDFLIFSDAEAVRRLKSLMEDPVYTSTQEALSVCRSDDLKVLPIHSFQAPARYGNEDHPEFEHILWREGDFSIHFNQLQKAADVEAKDRLMRAFLKKHPEYL